jgi:membrane fusion protein, heavy metal efflux system
MDRSVPEETEMRVRLLPRILFGIAFAVVAGGAVTFAATPSLRDYVSQLVVPAAKEEEKRTKESEPVKLIHGENGSTGLALTPAANEGLGIHPVAAKLNNTHRPLPPQVGTINFDNERMFQLRSRFQGELMEIKKVPDTGSPSPGGMRMLKYGDRVKQDDLLAVVWSVSQGQAKAALVDATCNLILSQDALDRQYKLSAQGATTITAVKLAEKQVQNDKNALSTAERTLIIMRLSDDELAAIKAEAKRIAELALDEKTVRNIKEEAYRWARVEVRAPKFSDDPAAEMMIVEKNVGLGDMVDPGKDPALFRLADMSRLQIWVHPPEEYLTRLRETLQKGPGRMYVQFQADPPGTPPTAMEFVQIAPSVEPNQHSLVVIGYLPNPSGNRYVVGQFVTATMYVPPMPDTVEIPTEALNEVGSQSLIFVQPDPTKAEYIQRRVSVVERFKDVAIVRTKLTKEDLATNLAEKGTTKLPLTPLQPGERVVTRGVIELTAALDDELAKARAEANK